MAEIRSRADVVQIIGERVPLKRAGHNFKGLCPFHAEKSPSFMVHPEKQIYHCFGCGEGGDVFSFLMKYDGVDFGEAVRTLAERCGVALTAGGADADVVKAKAEKDLLYKINRLAIRFFYETLQGSEGSRGREYLERRDVKPDMVREAYLGYAPADGRSLVRLLREKSAPLEAAERLGVIRKNSSGDYYDFFRDRLVFSVVSPDGKFLGFSGRALSDEVQPKYLNSPESSIYRKSETLLGLHMARPAIREEDRVLLVEGNFDLIRLHQEGIRNAVAPLGTALTEKQVRYLKRFTENFVLLFDGDAAGVKAAERALEIFLPLGVSPRVVLLPQGEDPDSFVRQKGADALKEMIGNAAPLLDVRMELIFKEQGGDPQGQAKAVRQVMEILSKLPGNIEKNLYLQRVAERFGLSMDGLASELVSKRYGARKESNFSSDAGDHGIRKFPAIERTVLEVLLADHANPSILPSILLEEIGTEDFLHPDLGFLWGRVKDGYRRDGHVDLGRILNELEEGPRRKLLTELAMAGGRWEEDADRVAADCLRQLRATKLRGRLKGLSQEIREAETVHDMDRVKELMDQKNRLMKEMAGTH